MGIKCFNLKFMRYLLLLIRFAVIYMSLAYLHTMIDQFDRLYQMKVNLVDGP